MPEVPQFESVLGFLLQNTRAILPSVALIMWGLGILLFDVLTSGRERKLGVMCGAFMGLGTAAVYLYLSLGMRISLAFYQTVTMDAFTFYFNALFLISALMTVIMSFKYLDIEDEQHGEYYALILFATSGMMFVAAATDLVSLFIGLELMSISTYVLVGFLRSRKRSNEASLKYFLLGAFSTGIILYGMSLLYGLTGSTNLHEIGRSLGGAEESTLLTLALFMMMAGMCFKVAAVPFHMWAPDAYEGAPTTITAFMSVGVKAAAFAMFFRLFYTAFGTVHDLYVFGLAVIAMVTITWGNVAAMTQTNIKRLLAYSSIAHAGFVLMGLVAGTQFGITASAFYLFAYTFMNLGAWAVVLLLRRQDIQGEELEDFDGLYFRHPSVAILMLIFFLSLAGIPPLGGFIAKYFVFAALMDAAFLPGSPHTSLMLCLAVVGALNVVVSLYYYFRIVVSMFMKKDYVPIPLSFSKGVVAVMILAGILTVWIGLYPEPFIRFAQAASEAIV
jgi:NADH-quinone oxidoreductase subunit N